MNVLSRKYLFLSNVDYSKTLNCDNGVVDVIRTGYSTDNEDPRYSVVLELAKRKVNP